MKNKCLERLASGAIGFLLLLVSLVFSPAASADEAAASSPRDFKVVAYYVDMRVQVMPAAALKSMAKEVAALGFNTLIVEWEAAYPYAAHSVISNRYAYTREEIADFIQYCGSLGLDVIPLQQSLGHLEYLLRHERYAYLRASSKDFSQVDPTQLDAARKLFTELYGDMLSTHRSKYVHIGGDEARLLSCARCQQAWGTDGEKVGKSRVYVEYMKMIAEIVVAHGKTPLIWADMILAYPDAVARMPKDVVYVDWNYGWAFDRFGEDPRTLIKKHGLKFWGASAIRSWPDDSHVTTWGTHLKNQADYIPYAREAGFEGMVLTSWSTSGEYSYEWLANGEAADITPIRQVYPHAYPQDAFRMSTAAFIEAIRQKDKLVPRDFSQRYAQQRFGLSVDDATSLWDILSSELLSNRIDTGSVPLSGAPDLPPQKRQAASQLAAVSELKRRLASIKPQRNVQEFAHYAMQVDIREFHLRFKVIQDFVQSAAFSDGDRPAVAKDLQALLVQARDLETRFKRMFTGALYESEIDNLNRIRSRQVVLLREQITRARAAGQQRRP